MQLIVRQTGWGEGFHADIYMLLSDVFKHLTRHLQVVSHGEIYVEPGCDDYPEVRYRNSTSDPYLVLLSARDRNWCQYSYQFAHELCHILSNYEQLRLPQSNWFHESLCELASIYVLRQMARTWRESPPYPHWADYSESLNSYTAEIFTRPTNTLPAGQSFQEWLSLNEGGLRENPYKRTLNCLVAVRLLPLFEQNPEIWRTIPYLPNSAADLHIYLDDWTLACPVSDRIFVQNIKVALFDSGGTQ